MSFTYNFLFFLALCFALSSLVAVQSLAPTSDVAALEAFKASIKPASIPPYSCIGSWDFSSDPCPRTRVSYFTCGVFCSASRITQISLDPAGYAGTLSPLISKLTQLTILDLSDNDFYGPIPPSLFSLPNLQTLVLGSNSFSGSIPPSISNSKSLQSLDLSHNSLSGQLPNTMSALNGLATLDLSFNKLTGSLPKLSPNLLNLAIKANLLSGSLSKWSFEGLTRLEVVELSENSLTGALQEWFFALPSIQQVDLANNSFTSVQIWKHAATNSGLVAVDLGYNKIEGEVPVNFAAFPLLSSLSLRYNRLRGPIPKEFSNKQSLRRLYLDGNYLNGSPPLGFFSGGEPVSGSFGDNCLQNCPISSQLCVKSQKPTWICRQAYGGKPRS